MRPQGVLATDGQRRPLHVPRETPAPDPACNRLRDRPSDQADLRLTRLRHPLAGREYAV